MDHRQPEWWRIAIASIGDAVITTDTNGNITFLNHVAETLTGWTLDEAVGQPLDNVFQIINEDSRRHVDNPATRALREGVVVGLANHTLLINKDGTRRPIDDSAAPIRNEAGEVSGVVLVFRDVADRRGQEIVKAKQAEEAIRQAEVATRQAEELADLHRRKDEFLAMLSHELRNPLAPVLNAVQLLSLQRDHENPVQQKARIIIERQVGVMKTIIDDLLEVSRITTGRIQLHKENLDLRLIVNRSVESVQAAIDQRHHELVISLPSEPIWLHADSVRLEQVLVNLLNNASKYTREGGRILLTLQQDGEEAVLSVKDTGIGIGTDLLPRIFDLFMQGKQSLDRSQGGLGIGLTIVQKLLEVHGGKVEAFSTLGQGSEFVVHLPVVAMQHDDVKAPQITQQGRLRVLVVDDNLDMVESMAMMLEQFGHEVQTAYDGNTAIEVALSNQPAVVLLDIGLPGLSGYEVAKRLRQQPGFQKAVLVAMTGYGRDEDKQASKDAGFDYHLIKPVDFSKLEHILATVSKQPA